jgi:hypothetical protein
MPVADQLREAVTSEVFAGLWPDDVPPHDAFLEFLGGLLATHLPADVTHLSAAPAALANLESSGLRV